MNLSRRTLLAGIAATASTAASARLHAREAARPAVGSIERLDPAFDAVVAPGEKVEVIATGYRWAEGPIWVPGQNALLFSDVPANVIHRWTAKGGAKPFLQPSGLADPIPPTIREAGANGLDLDAAGRLVMADSGTRVVARVDLATRRKTILADRFENKRFNSPNDVVVAPSGAIYFTDPPYGLADAEASPLRELAFNGVYRLAPDGTVAVVDRSLHRPNGVGLSPDGRTLYVSLSDEKRPEVLAYSLDRAGMPTGVRRFIDMRAGLAAGLPGLPDGMTVDRAGRVFATGPGGVHVCAPDGRLLGRIGTGKATANCAIGEGGRTLFLTSSDMIARVRLRRAG